MCRNKSPSGGAKLKILCWISVPLILGIALVSLLYILWDRVDLSGEARLVEVVSDSQIIDAPTPHGVQVLVEEREYGTETENRRERARRAMALLRDYLYSLSSSDHAPTAEERIVDIQQGRSIRLTKDEVEGLIGLAEGGSSEAARDLASHYLALGDLESASHFSHLAAVAGNTDPLVNLADHLADQNAETVDRAEAFLLYGKAVELGSDEALLPLALYYEEGEFTDRDIGEAFRLIELARESDIPEASYHAARFHESGAYARQDYELARNLYLDAAGAGMGEAYVRLGIFEREGYLGEPDWQQADVYFTRALELGDAGGGRLSAQLNWNPDYEQADSLKSLESLIRSAIMGDSYAKSAVASSLWRSRDEWTQLDGDAILNLLVPGAVEGNLDSIGLFDDISTQLDLAPVFQEVANELRHDLFEDGRFSLAPELAEYELTSGYPDPEEAHDLALSYLDFAQQKDSRSRLVLEDFHDGKGSLIDLIREYRSLTYAELAQRVAKPLAGFSRPPTVLEAPPPVYPDGLRHLGVEGAVAVTFEVDTEGSVRDIDIREIDHESFRVPVEEALKSWRFEPGLGEDGQPKPARMGIVLRFRVGGK